MKKKRKGELPSGSIRRRVFVGYEPVFDDKGRPVTDASGKQKKKRKYLSITASSSQEANEEVLKAKISRSSPAALSDCTFREAREKYIDSVRNILSPSTIRGYVSMRTYFRELDEVKIKNLNNDTVQLWINNFSLTHSPKTVRNGYGLIVTVLSQYGVSMNGKLPAKKVNSLYTPTDEEVHKIIEYFREKNDTDMIISICLASFATLRRSEICGLMAEDVHGNTIHVHNSQVVDENQKTVLKDKTKNKSSDRYIEIPEFVSEMLPKQGMIVNIKPDNITSRFCRGLKKTGIQPFRFHDLRHYSASIMHAIGIPDVYIMERGGWKSDDTLKKVYRGTLEDYKKKFVEQTNSYFENMHHECTTETENS